MYRLSTIKISFTNLSYTVYSRFAGAATLTAVIPKIPKLRLDLADIHADIRDSSPHIIGPGAANSTGITNRVN